MLVAFGRLGQWLNVRLHPRMECNSETKENHGIISTFGGWSTVLIVLFDIFLFQMGHQLPPKGETRRDEKISSVYGRRTKR